jgi:hypothetical protein
MQRVAVVAWASGRRPFSLEVTKGATMRNTLALYRGVRSIGFHSVYRTIREFGLRNGLVVSRARATSAAKSSPQGKLTRVFTRNSGLPIYLREGTSDWSVLDQISTVRSIAEQIQLVIVHDRFGTVGRLYDDRFYRGFFKYCHRKYLH